MASSRPVAVFTSVFAVLTVILGSCSPAEQTTQGGSSSAVPDAPGSQTTNDLSWIGSFIERDQRLVQDHGDHFRLWNPGGLLVAVDAHRTWVSPHEAERGIPSPWGVFLMPPQIGRSTRGDLADPAVLGEQRNGFVLSLQHRWGKEVFENRKDGVEHSLYVEAAPSGEGEVAVEIPVDLSEGMSCSAQSSDAVAFTYDNETVLTYSGLVVRDATGRRLEAHLDCTEESVSIAFDDSSAEYPVHVDPALATSSSRTDPTDQAYAYFGWSVAGVGDVDGDGYSDLLVGAPYYDSTVSDEGKVYLFAGSSTGTVTAVAEWTSDPTDQSAASFGDALAGLGDVNGDGYGDVAIAASNWDDTATDEGRVYIFLGSALGLVSGSTIDPTDQASAHFGETLAGIGDSDRDGYDELLVAAPDWDGTATNEGRAWLYDGSAAGLSATPTWYADPTDATGTGFGQTVAGAGDINGDGYADFAVGAPSWDGGFTDEGRVFVYSGAAMGPSTTAAWDKEPMDQTDARFGSALASSDINADGYSELVVGSSRFDSSTYIDEGRVMVYSGSAAGLATTASWTQDPTDQASAQFGSALAAGDFNGDGRGDVAIGAVGWDSTSYVDEGRVYVFLGTKTGLGSSYWYQDPTDQVVGVHAQRAIPSVPRSRPAR